MVDAMGCNRPKSEVAWVNIIASRCKKPSEKPHLRVNLRAIRRIIAT
jgi:hypothetical protein